MLIFHNINYKLRGGNEGSQKTDGKLYVNYISHAIALLSFCIFIFDSVFT